MTGSLKRDRDRLIEAMRQFNHEIMDDTPIMEANAMLIEAIYEQLVRLNERVSFLEPYEED